jgi:hypothetical protein
MLSALKLFILFGEREARKFSDVSLDFMGFTHSLVE